VLSLFAKHYPDYGPTLASEKLHERSSDRDSSRNPALMAASSATALQTPPS
jgi:hypothetical protein